MLDFAAIAGWISSGRMTEKVAPARHFLNASSIFQCCLRERLLSWRGRREGAREVSRKEAFCRAFGTFYHLFLQTLLEDFLLCTWTCRKCGWKSGFGRKPSVCQCGCRDFAMSETSLFDRRAQVAGFCDGVVDMAGLQRAVDGDDALEGFGPQDLWLMEIKTVGHPFFESASQETLPEAWLWQANFYYKEVSRDLADLSGIVFLLLDRDTYAVRLIPSEPSWTVQEKLLAKALDFQAHRKAGTLPPYEERADCPSCPMAAACMAEREAGR